MVRILILDGLLSLHILVGMPVNERSQVYAFDQNDYRHRLYVSERCDSMAVVYLDDPFMIGVLNSLKIVRVQVYSDRLWQHYLTDEEQILLIKTMQDETKSRLH
jgi:hypothetical protein